MLWVGRDLSDRLVPTPAVGRDTSQQTRLLTAPSSLALSASREGASPASLGNLCQCLTTLTVKNFFLISCLNLTSSSLKPFPLLADGLVYSLVWTYCFSVHHFPLCCMVEMDLTVMVDSRLNRSQ